MNILIIGTGIYENRIQPAQLEGSRLTFSESLYSTAVIEAVCKSLQNLSSWQHVTMAGL